MRWLVGVPVVLSVVSFGWFLDPGFAHAGVVAVLVALAGTGLAVMAARGPRPVWVAACLVSGAFAAGFAAIAADQGPGFVVLAPLFPLAMGVASWTWRSPDPPRLGAVRAVMLWAAMVVAASLALAVSEGWLAITGLAASGDGIVFAPVGVIVGASIEAGRRRGVFLAAVVLAATAVAAVDGVSLCQTLDCLVNPSADGLLVAGAYSAVGAAIGYGLGVAVRSTGSTPVDCDRAPEASPVRF